MFAFDGGRAAGVVGLALGVLGQAAALGGPVSGVESSPPFRPADLGPEAAVITLDRAALTQLAAADTVFTIDRFPLNAQTSVDLELQRFTVTDTGTQFVVGNTGGADEPLAFDPDRVTLLRGTVAGEADSHVFMAFSEWGSIGRIEMSGGRYVLAASAADASDLVEVHVTESDGGGFVPGVPFCATVAPSELPVPPQALGGPVTAEITQEIEIALETDYELFELFGSLDATSAYIVELWGAISDIYLRDVNTRVKVTFVRLWDDPDDLFNAEDPLQDFVVYWQDNMGFVERDVAQFVSGRRNMPYGGVAYVSALCSDFAYGLVGYIIGHFSNPDDPPDVFGYDVQVCAHELGHNCGTFHTHDYGIDSCNNLTGVPQRSTIMSYCSQTRSGANGNTDLRFHADIQLIMENHIFVEVDCTADDCNGNGVDDATDISQGGSADVNTNGIPDECEDCNNNQVLDPTDIANLTSDDDNNNGVPDECEPDCNNNGQPDDLDIAQGVDTDLYGNNIPDGCEADCDGSGTSDYTEIQADMSLDIDRNAILDSCQDCDNDQISDFDELAGAHNTWVASSADSALAEFHALSGVKVKPSDAGQLDDSQDLIITAGGRVLVSSAGDDRVVEFDGTGSYVGDLVTAGSGGLNFPTGLAISPLTGNLLVGSHLTDEVLEYDGTSGASQGAFVTAGLGGLLGPWGLAFGPNGNLFVTSDNGKVVEYDGSTGALVGDFVTTGDNGGLIDPRGMLFKPNGNLLVCSLVTDQILEYDAVSGAFIGQFNNGGTATVLTLDEPWTVRLGPDGDVYASRHNVVVASNESPNHDHHNGDVDHLHINSTRIYIFDVDSGNFVRSYVTGHDTGLSNPTAFDFMPGDATDCNYNQIPDSCDITSMFSEDNNGDNIPDECQQTTCLGDLDGDGQIGIIEFLAVLGNWGPVPPGHPLDIDGDNEIGITEFLYVLGNWGPC